MLHQNVLFAVPLRVMNTENVLKKVPNAENYRFGLSTLHCYIRFFECLLHIAYRLPIKSWQVKGNEHKEIVEKNLKKNSSRLQNRNGPLGRQTEAWMRIYE